MLMDDLKLKNRIKNSEFLVAGAHTVFVSWSIWQN